MDEEFWRDVFKSVVSASIFSLIALVVAISFGYVRRPDNRDTALGILIVFVLLLVSWVAGWVLGTRTTQRWVQAIPPRRRHQLMAVLGLNMVVGVIMAIAIVVQTTS